MKLFIRQILILFALCMSFCSSDLEKESDTAKEEVETSETTEGLAQVTEVTVSGSANQYNFSATISSPDLGCNQYANWWEVLDLDGNLIYRRILGHSHVEEQPFTRSGGPIAIAETTEVYIRAHMNTTGYGAQVFKGSVASGFTAQDLSTEFAKELEETAPLPGNCAF